MNLFTKQKQIHKTYHYQRVKGWGLGGKLGVWD